METEPPLRSVERDREANCMKRIVVVGTSGSGKTTLARQLSSVLNIPSVELDELHWDPNWTPVALPTFRDRVEAALSGDAWVVDGNYKTVRDLTWGRADTVIWLDYRLWIVMKRVICRTVCRVFLGETLYNGNRENLQTALLSKDSIILWAFTSHGVNRHKYATLARDPAYAHLALFRFSSPQATQSWLENVQPTNVQTLQKG